MALIAPNLRCSPEAVVERLEQLAVESFTVPRAIASGFESNVGDNTPSAINVLVTRPNWYLFKHDNFMYILYFYPKS